MEHRLKVLISAYACEPGKGSEPAVGWNLARCVAKFCDVTVVTRANNREAIEAYEHERGGTGVTWVYHDAGDWALALKRLMPWTWPAYYAVWQFGILKLCQALHREQGFDLLHHLTFGSFLSPSFLHRMAIPFLWGPLGGAQLQTRQFVRLFSMRGKALEWLRTFLIRSRLINVLQRSTLSKAARVLVVSDESRRVLGLSQARCSVFSQVGLAEAEVQRLSQIPIREHPGKMIIMAGRLVHWKGFALGIKSFSRCRRTHPDARMMILGSGPEAGRLKQLAVREATGSVLTFVGHVSREEYFRHLEAADVLLFPSSHEPGAYVVIECMAAGRPVICTDFGEPATLIAGGCGIAVDPAADDMVAEFADALDRLFTNPDRARAMGSAGRIKVGRQYGWDQKAAQMAAVYQDIALRRSGSADAAC